MSLSLSPRFNTSRSVWLSIQSEVDLYQSGYQPLGDQAETQMSLIMTPN